LISPGDCTLQCDMRLWNHDSEFTCSAIRGSGMTCHGIRPNVRRIGILHLVSILITSPQSTCHYAPVCEMLSKSDHAQQKNDVMSIFKMADLSHSSKLFSFWENRVFAIWRQTDKQTNRWTRLLREAALAVASGGLTTAHISLMY